MSYDRETLVVRLRHHEPIVRNNAVYDAAAEIERLRAENERLTKREAEASDLLDESVRLLERGDALLAQAMTGGARDA